MESHCGKLESGPITQRPLRVNNVARRLQRSERRVRQLAEAGEIPAFKIDGKSWGFRPSDVDLYKQLLEARDADQW
jgi:excisionase family DNA binding protein